MSQFNFNFDATSFDGVDPGGSYLKAAAAALGPLPKRIRYFDEYDEQVRSVEALDENWLLSANGQEHILKFERISGEIAHVLKHFAVYRLQKNAVTAAHYLHNILSTLSVQVPLVQLAVVDPNFALDHLRSEFSSASRHVENTNYFQCGKAVLAFFCDIGLAGWEEAHSNILRTVRSPIARSKHRTVRDGSAILTFEEERKVIDHLDEISTGIRQGNEGELTTEILRDSAILMLCFQHAMRPIQIANRNVAHVRIREAEDGQAIVHLTFRYAKQRTRQKIQEQTRKIKRDWAPILVAWLRRREELEGSLRLDRAESLFGVPPQEVTRIVRGLTEALTGIRRTPYQLRHTAAQRKADAGCSRLELAEFLMHSDIDTADAYIEMSPTQAEKINAALGLSPLFQAIDASLKSKSVDLEELNKLPEDQQVSGAPHGHLIAGIGGCAIGQSFCPKTPALACYDCHKFMYLREIEVHRTARDSIRKIVGEFIGTNKGDKVTPAYGQLRRVLETVETIISDLDGEEASQ